MNESYGKGTKPASAKTNAMKVSKIKNLTDITQSFSINFDCGSSAVTNSKHKGYIITKFTYNDKEQADGSSQKYAHWNPKNGQWYVDDKADLYAGSEAFWK